MFSFMTRRFAAIAVLLAALTLAGCADKEPEQRKAFIDFLQTQVVDKSTLSVPKPSAEQAEGFGPYAAQYRVIVDFNENMANSSKVLQEGNALQAKLRNMEGVRDNWKQVAELLPQIDIVMKSLDEEEKKAEAAHAAMKQPDDLKAVYDKVFAQRVTDQVQALKQIMPPSGKALRSLANLGQFMDENRDRLKISGMTIDSDDAALLSKLQALQSTYAQDAQDLLKAVQPVMNKLGQKTP